MVAAVADAWDSDAGLESTLVALRLLAHRYVALHIPGLDRPAFHANIKEQISNLKLFYGIRRTKARKISTKFCILPKFFLVSSFLA